LPPFKIYQLQLRDRHYLLLPKLNSRQMQTFARRLERKGYSVEKGGSMTAKSSKGTIHISPSGLCWSSSDPSDAVLPAVPDILACPKEPAPLGRIESMYYKLSRVSGGTLVRLSTRMESSLWDELRASGQCGLSPDEHTVASFMMRRAKGDCGLLTDFPTDESIPRISGRRRFYESNLSVSEALATLEVVGAHATRNSYLKRDGILRLGSVPLPSRDEKLRLIDDLEDWCYFTPE